MVEIRQKEDPQIVPKEEVKERVKNLKTLAEIILKLLPPAELKAAEENAARYPGELNWLAGAKDEALQVCKESLEAANALVKNPTSEVMQKSTKILFKAIDQALFLGENPESLTQFLPDKDHFPLEDIEPPGGLS